MGLQVAIPYKNTGITLNYWRILSFNFNADTNSFDLFLAGYPSYEDRVAGKSYIGIHKFNWSGANNPVTIPVIQAGGAFTAVYTKVKESVLSVAFNPDDEIVETNPFVNAVDVL
jgi:hypothetical protein